MDKSTKIVATLGPVSDSKEMIENLFKSGMDVARLNFSHGDYSYFERVINTIREVDDNIGILLDTKGPEIRSGKIAEGETLLEQGKELILTREEIEGDDSRVTVFYDKLEDLTPGVKVLVDDGLIELEVLENENGEVKTLVLNGGILGSKKTISIQGYSVEIDFLSQKDKDDLLFGIEKDVDFVAASFVRTPEDVKELKTFLSENGGSDISIISKIEHPQAVENIDEIIKLSNGIMVARGDLGVEVPLHKVPEIQEQIVRKCNFAGKPVIVATQMLESMKSNPRPTRAEVSDVAQAILQGTDAIMLSGETASGKYPQKAVKMMSEIAKTYDPILVKKALIRNEHYFNNVKHSISTFITKAAYEAASQVEVNALVVPTESGFSARQVSKFKPRVPIYALGHTKKVVRQLNLSWGVKALEIDIHYKHTNDLVYKAVLKCYDSDLIVKEDKVVITAGHVLREAGHTNILEIFKVGHILDKLDY